MRTFICFSSLSAQSKGTNSTVTQLTFILTHILSVVALVMFSVTFLSAKYPGGFCFHNGLRVLSQSCLFGMCVCLVLAEAVFKMEVRMVENTPKQSILMSTLLTPPM